MIFWVTTICVLLLDRAAKYLVSSNMQQGQTIPILQDFFHITYVKNPGAAFGILANQRWFFILAAVVVVGILIYLAHTMAQKKLWLSIILGLVAGGALGNMIDRISSGLVLDYLDFRGIWPFVFNIADSAVVIGVILLAFQLLRAEEKEE